MIKIRAFLASILLVGLVPLFLFSAVAYTYEVREAEDRILRRNEQVAETVASGLRSFVSQAIVAEEVVGSAVIQLDPEPGQIRQLLFRARRDSESLNTISYADSRGRPIVDSPGDARRIPRDSIRRIRAGASSVVSNLRPIGPRRAEFHVTIGVRQGGNLRAIVDGTVRDDTVFDLVKFRVGRRGNVGIIDARGRAVALSLRRDVSWGQRDRTFIPGLQEALNGKPTTVRSFHDRLGNTRRMGASVPIQPFGWAADVFQPVDEVLGPVRAQAMFQAIASVLMSIVGLLIVFLLARFITDPIERMAKGTAPLSEGDFSHTLPTDFRISELTALGKALNSANAEIRRLFDAERHIAGTLQAESLPVEPPKLPGFDLGTYYASATERALVGGDFYDFIPLSRNRLAVVIGDVQGKGVEAAVSTVTTKFTLRNLLAERRDPEWVLDRLNAACLRELGPEQFITLVLLIIDCTTGDITYASAGHHPPFVCGERGCRKLETNGPALGLTDRPEYPVGKENLAPGEILSLYTDGSIEARSDADFFGVERLIDAVADNRLLRAQALSQKLYLICLDFANGRLVDDIAVVLIKRE